MTPAETREMVLKLNLRIYLDLLNCNEGLETTTIRKFNTQILAAPMDNPVWYGIRDNIKMETTTRLLSLRYI